MHQQPHRTTLLAVALAVAVCTAAIASAALPPAPTPELVTLDNGLEVLLLAEDAQPAVAVQIWYRIGSRYETEQTLGMAHLFEHLMAMGTASTPSFSDAVTGVGGRTGSITWPDATVFHTEAPGTALDTLLGLEADRMRHLRLEADTIQQAETIVGDELTQVITGAPLTFVDTRLRALAFAKNPYGNPTKGRPTLGATPVEQCRAFYDRYYRPENACLVLVGGFDRDAALARVRHHFGSLPRAEASPGARSQAAVDVTPAEPASVGGAVENLDLGAPVAVLSLAYPLPGESSGSAHALRILLHYLNGPAHDAIASSLIEDDRPLAQRIDFSLTLERDAGLFLVNIPLLDPADAATVRSRILSRLGSLEAEVGGMEPAELAAIRDFERFRSASSRSTVADRATALATAYLLRGDLDSYDSGDQIETVDGSALARAAGYLAAPRAVTVGLGTRL